MKTGCYGNIVFEVSSEEVKTFNSFSHSASANYTAHQRAAGTSLLEFTGLGADTVSLKILVSAYLGSSPMSEYWKLVSCLKLAEPNMLIIGNNVIGDGEWVITSISLDAKHFDTSGSVTSCEISLSLKGYLEE